jgi:predicted transcriptional regulator
MTIDRDPMFAPTKVSAPYNGTAGYVPVGTSRDAAYHSAASGTLAARQRRIFQILGERGPIGATSAEIEEWTGEGHGKVSGALSSMHKDGAIVALKNVKRNHCGAYVLPEHTGDRPVREFKSIEQAKAEQRPPTKPRPQMTPQERELIENLRTIVGQSGDSIFRMKASTGRAVLAVVDRLSRA